jgi:hypothetical protein
MVDQYDGDHQDFRRGKFGGPFTAKAEYHQRGPVPTALDALPPRAAGFTGRGSELGQLSAPTEAAECRTRADNITP